MLDLTTRNDLLDRAILAPSSHNTQPWIFLPEPGGIALLADRTRALPVNDPDDRELTISCGCALMNLRVAAAEKGVPVDWTTFPEGPDSDMLARVAFSGRTEPDLQPIAHGIAVRRTYRKRFKEIPIAADIIAALGAAAEAEGADLRVVADPDRKLAVAELVKAGDLAQWDDPHWRRELAAWMHPRRKGDGLALPGLAVPVAQAVVRSFDMGGGVAAKDRELAEQSPILAVLASQGDGPEQWLEAGQALERVLLTGAVHGLQASYLNQPIQITRLREDLRKAGEVSGHPQVLLRMGYPEEDLPPAPRRQRDEVVSETP